MGMLLSRHYANDTDNNNNNNENTAGKGKGVTKKEMVAPEPKAKKSTKSTELAYTERDIKAMNGTKLRKLAKENGIKDPEELTVGELKAILCDKLVK